MSNLTPISPKFAVPGPSTLVFKETKGLSLSGDSGKVLDAEGNLTFEIDAKLMTMSDRRIIKDAKGAAVGQVRKKRVTPVHACYYLGTMDDEKKCAVKAKGMMNPTKCDADIYLGDTVIGEATGNWRAKTFTVTIDGKQAAAIKRNTGAAGYLLSADTYSIEMAAGVDGLFMTMVVIALDEIYHDSD